MKHVMDNYETQSYTFNRNTRGQYQKPTLDDLYDPEAEEVAISKLPGIQVRYGEHTDRVHELNRYARYFTGKVGNAALRGLHEARELTSIVLTEFDYATGAVKRPELE